MGMNLREMINGKRLVTIEIKVVETQDVFKLEYMALQWVDWGKPPKRFVVYDRQGNKILLDFK